MRGGSIYHTPVDILAQDAKMTDRTGSPVFERSERPGNALLLLALAIAIVAAPLVYFYAPAAMGPRFIILGLALFAGAGVFSLFAYAVGLLRFANKAGRYDTTKLAVDTAPDAMLVTRGDAIEYANEAYMALCGASEPGALQTVDRMFSGPPEVSESIYRLVQAARAGTAHTEDLRLSPSLHGGNGVGWYRVRVRPLDGASLWTVCDLTADRERQENVFQELQHAIDFLDHAPAGFFSAKADGAVSYMNKTLAGWLGYDLTQVGSGGATLASIIANSGAALLSTFTGAPGEVKTEQFDLDLRCRNGRSLPVRLLHQVAFGQDGAAGASRTLVLNRAAGEQPEENLRAAEVRFARFFNSTPMAMATLDADGRILTSNASFARMLPQALKTGQGKEAAAWAVLAGLGDRDGPALRKAIEDALEGKSDIRPVNVMLEEGAGPARSMRFFVSPAEEEGRKGAMVYALDTSEQRKLQEEFAQSQKMNAVGQLAGGIAHDFNNMLTAIIGYSDLLLSSHRPTDPAFRDIRQIKETANRAAGLTRQLLAFSRRQTLRPQVLQLGDALSELQILLRRVVGEKNQLELRHGRDLWFVKADMTQFEQVIINLVVNARDAMAETGGRVQIRTRNVSAADCASFNEAHLPVSDYVLVEVEDSGSGIPAEVKEKIFEPFFTTKEVGKGTGLGLSTVFGIVKQSGGFIFVDSEVGRGTVFRIFLPRHIPEEKAEPQKTETAKAAADYTGQGVVLLVEDEDAVRSIGARALSSRGFTVLEATTGLEALEVVERVGGKIDLIVSDVVMPEMDGPAMFAELRKRGVDAKVIFVSGYAEEAFAKNLPEGDFGFLPKPFSIKQLIETVKTHIE